MNSKFKPCPFCGNEPNETISYEEDSLGKFTVYEVTCPHCEISMSSCDLNDLCCNWNLGAALQEVKQAIAQDFTTHRKEKTN